MSAQLSAAELWSIVPLDAARVPTILDIERHGYRYPWSEAIIRDCFKSGTGVWGVENASGELIAYAFFSMAVGEAHVLNLCVDPTVQGQGVGRYLMQHLITLARAALCTIVLLEVRRSNTAARRLYAGLGFAHLGTRKGYYPAAEGREDALVLGYEITDVGTEE